MKIICKNTKNIIIAFAFACIFLVNASPAEAECYPVCNPILAPCPGGYSVWQNQMYPWALSPFLWACFPCGGYGCWLGPAYGHVGGPVCATSLYSGCIDIGPYVVGWNCFDRCNGECNNSVLYGCTVPNSTTAAINIGETATHWTWQCPQKNGGNNSGTCSYPKPSVNGACQTSPSGVDPLPASICVAGTASAVLGSGTNIDPWSWTCKGSGPLGTDASCTARKPCVYNNYQCITSGSNPCVDNYLANCEKSVTISKICVATDVNGTCSGALSQSDCVSHGVSCANSMETCPSCPVKFGGWREVSP